MINAVWKRQIGGNKETYGKKQAQNHGLINNFQVILQNENAQGLLRLLHKRLDRRRW